MSQSDISAPPAWVMSQSGAARRRLSCRSKRRCRVLARRHGLAVRKRRLHRQPAAQGDGLLLQRIGTMKLSDKAAAALAGAISTRGPNKGKLLRTAPHSSTLACAAWQGAMMAVNPFKASIMSMMMMDEEQRLVRDEVLRHFEAMPKRERITFDKDRAGLERLGVW